MFKKMIAMLLSLLLCASAVVCVPAYAAEPDDYRSWKQFDPEWNREDAWPAGQYPAASLHKMSQGGCLVTSIAMLLRQYQVVSQDPSVFNPWICNETLKQAGAFTNAADLIWDKVGDAYPNFRYAGSCSYSMENLRDLLNKGYACVLQVNGSGGYMHYVAADAILDNAVLILDPGSHSNELSHYASAKTIYYFEAKPASYIDRCPSWPTNCELKVHKKTFLMTLPCSHGLSEKDGGGELSEVAGTARVGSRYYAIGLLRNSAGNLWYRILMEDGSTAFIAGDCVDMLRPAFDLHCTDFNSPHTLNVGQIFCVKGTVSSGYSRLCHISAGVYRDDAYDSASGTWNTAEALTLGEARFNGNEYTLDGSPIDKNVEFNRLPAGHYTYVVQCSAENFYADGLKDLTSRVYTGIITEMEFDVK